MTTISPKNPYKTRVRNLNTNVDHVEYKNRSFRRRLFKSSSPSSVFMVIEVRFVFALIGSSDISVITVEVDESLLMS